MTTKTKLILLNSNKDLIYIRLDNILVIFRDLYINDYYNKADINRI